MYFGVNPVYCFCESKFLTKERIKMIKVYHADRSIARDMPFGGGSKLFDFVVDNSESYNAVAVVYTDDLEKAYELTLSIMTPWFDGDFVETSESVKAAGGARSSMVGDVFVMPSGKEFMVDNCGFTALVVDM